MGVCKLFYVVVSNFSFDFCNYIDNIKGCEQILYLIIG